ncbi:uncharacterized protein Zcchc7 isoform X6 [Drosophila pseudoobscura]|uniref:Uncharacterized protein Zcchc7 isoform X6 n=1 Tax=Drosophila pseudoobscura pseudoobscura TaxID=46245 RepID=A0A6I8W2E8_DROPS|nr:uncharacterized protein LOC6900150 isoform X6 [Drosophila pseudoobscura]
MSDLEDMDSERLNELESILYASIHYSDHGSGETGAGEISPSVADQQRAVDAQYMPPPPQQQQKQPQAQRIVSNKRVINNAVAKPRYWAEEKDGAGSIETQNVSTESRPVRKYIPQLWIAFEIPLTNSLLSAMKYLRSLLALGSTTLRILFEWLGLLNPVTLVLATLNLLCLVVWLDYHFRQYGCDLLFWQKELSQFPHEYILTGILMTAATYVLVSVVDVVVFTALLRRNLREFNKPLLHYEERYRRFVLIRLVRQLEHALVMQTLSANASHVAVKNMCEAQRMIKEAINMFRTSVKVLLWPNRSDLHEDPFILYHINEGQLEELNAHGYCLGDVDSLDLGNQYLKYLLNPFWY